MLRDFFGNFIFAIIARTLCGNHLKTAETTQFEHNNYQTCFEFFSCVKSLQLRNRLELKARHAFQCKGKGYLTSEVELINLEFKDDKMPEQLANRP